MRPTNFTILPPPDSLKEVVLCFRVGQYTGQEAFSINVGLNGLPGIVLQHHQGQSPVENIITPSGSTSGIPTLYIYGQMTEPGIMNHKGGPYALTQVILKPHALKTLFGVNAATLTNRIAELHEFSAKYLNEQLLEAKTAQEQVALLTRFLVAKRQQAQTRDPLVEASLTAIHRDSASITVKALLDDLHISERQFERRFTQAVGLSPQFYIRVKRFNEAVRLMQSRQYARLTDIAHALNFHDQSHFIRDVKAFSGIPPKRLTQQAADLHGPVVFSYV